MRRRAITVERLASLVEGAWVFDLPDNLAHPRGAYEALYAFLERRGCKPSRIHDRTFVGESAMKVLDAAQRSFLKTRSKRDLETRLTWSSLSGGPQGRIAERVILGDGVCVLPHDADLHAVEIYLTDEAYRSEVEANKRERARFDAEDFYHWLIGARDHDDVVGDLARIAYGDSSSPKEGSRETYVAYFLGDEDGRDTDEEGAFDQAWREFSSRRGRGGGSAPATKVYFVRSGDGPIKIGYSSDVDRRIASLRTAHHTELTLLAQVDGSLADEKALHARFGHLRRSGEWFDPAPELLSFIGSLRLVAGHQ